MDDAETGDWLNQREAAERLSAGGDHVSQQMLSKYLDQYPEIARRAGPNGSMLVNFDVLRLHREQNIHVQERHAAESASAADDPVVALRFREREAAAQMRELELARAKGEMIPREAVERGIQAAATALSQAHTRTRFVRNEELEASADFRARIAILDRQDREIEEKFAQALAHLSTGGDSATEEENEDDEAPETEAATAALPPSPQPSPHDPPSPPS